MMFGRSIGRFARQNGNAFPGSPFKGRRLLGAGLLTGFLGTLAAVAVTPQQAMAAGCDTVISGTNTFTSGSQDCITTGVGGATGDLDLILQGSQVGPEGISFFDRHTTTGEMPYDFQISITNNFGAAAAAVENNFGTAIVLSSTGAVTGLASRDAGTLSVATQIGGDIHGTDGAISATGASFSLVNTGADITGDLTGFGSDAVIEVSVSDSVNIQNTGGSIAYSGGPNPTGLAIDINSATDILVNNGGTIFGRIDFLGGETSLFTNTSSHSWITTGTNYFTNGSDTLSNTSTGLIEAQDDTSFDFFNTLGANDVVQNDGEFRNVRVGNPVVTRTDFTDLEGFFNAGLINLHDGNTNAGDQFNLISSSGGLPSGLYLASGAAELSVDSRLGGLSSTLMPGLLSDSLTIGVSSGVTTVLVADTVAQDKASYNPTGILVVNGSSALGHFILNTGSDYYSAAHVYETTTASYRNVLDKGLFFYDLLYTPAPRQHRLYGVPDAEAFELTRLETAAQSIWYSTSPWLDRQADLRDTLTAGGSVTPGLWLKAFGGWASRDTTDAFAVAGYNYTYDIDYDQNTYGAVAGFDVGGEGVFGEHDAILVGLSGGYVDSNVDFNSPTSATFKGAVAGLYATYLNGGFYIDATAKANLLKMDYSAPTLAGFSASPNVRTYGGQIDTGWRFGESLFIEPLATLAYARTSIDSFTVLGTGVDFQDADSLRGSLGLRLGGQAKVSQGTLVSASLTGRVWNEFEGQNDVAFHSEGPDLVLDDDFGGAYSEIGGSINVIGTESGWSGFINGGTKFKSDYTDTSVKVGIRLQF
ncbi:MAG: autotransporter outer membrane beta-barrel domain-containing protein [Parvibaculum sp.]|uniref:autotransporter domain-containing protein n=1 Tax=Parvibaculum sp. TaxID=2024848 RepID=UPI0025DC84D0|nr:autotransporter outer membrane beta-barrel domain-containing protein [Parvibaculum sp.]MCE9648538.1 autotransporter outer membrane beta-barrel domain-containing protein [Parvibaculum sp.]